MLTVSCHIQTGAYLNLQSVWTHPTGGSLQPPALSLRCMMGQAGSGSGDEITFLEGIGIPGEKEPVSSFFTVDCTSTPPQASWAIYSLTPKTQTVVCSFSKV